MRNLIVLVLLLLFVSPIGLCQGVYLDSKKGYAIDGTGQLPYGQQISPSKKTTQQPQYTQTIVPFEKYIKDTSTERRSYYNPIVPNYNAHYSERRAVPYTKQQYIDVWCTGDKNVKGVDCIKGEYAITFVRARNWAGGSMKAIYKAKKAHKTPVLFLMVDDICLDGEYMQEAKAWAQMWNTLVYFGTIDSYIPWEYLAS